MVDHHKVGPSGAPGISWFSFTPLTVIVIAIRPLGGINQIACFHTPQYFHCRDGNSHQNSMKFSSSPVNSITHPLNRSKFCRASPKFHIPKVTAGRASPRPCSTRRRRVAALRRGAAGAAARGGAAAGNDPSADAGGALGGAPGGPVGWAKWWEFLRKKWNVNRTNQWNIDRFLNDVHRDIHPAYNPNNCHSKVI